MGITNTPTVYLRLYKTVRLPQDHPILLGQIAQIVTDPAWEEKLNRLVVATPQEREGDILLVDMTRVVQRIKHLSPSFVVEHFGDPHTLIEFTSKPKRPSLPFVIFIWLLLFTGSGLAIMNFHTDVSMMQVHQKVYFLLTGENEKHPLWLQIPYSIGIGAGMLLFFNRIFRKRINEEPNPLELELYNYQQNVNQYIVTEEYKKYQSEHNK